MGPSGVCRRAPSLSSHEACRHLPAAGQLTGGRVRTGEGSRNMSCRFKGSMPVQGTHPNFSRPAAPGLCNANSSLVGIAREKMNMSTTDAPSMNVHDVRGEESTLKREAGGSPVHCPRRPPRLQCVLRAAEGNDPRSPLTPLSGDGIRRSIRHARSRSHLRASPTSGWAAPSESTT